ncbi:hypothetical protein D3C71_2097830 [compost metagenome]
MQVEQMMLQTVAASPVFAEQCSVGSIIQVYRYIQQLLQPFLDMYLRPARRSETRRIQNDSFLTVQRADCADTQPDHTVGID